MTYQSILKKYIVFLYVLLGVSLFYIHGERPKMNDANESKSLGKVENLIDAWVEMWNSYDLLQVDRLFLTGSGLTYFSSEKEGVIKGIDAVREHHKGFGFVEGGKKQENKLWLEDIQSTHFESTVIVSAIWYFRKRPGKVQRGPVTFVCVKEKKGFRFAHLHFANYK